jgi:predicted nuclease of predicted toxin-antitoxin system
MTSPRDGATPFLAPRTIAYYFDEMMPRPAAEQLSQKSITVVMAVDVEMAHKRDDQHLSYATEHGLVLVTFDRKFAGLSMADDTHAGLICIRGSPQDVGVIVRGLHEFAESHTQDDCSGRVFWL